MKHWIILIVAALLCSCSTSGEKQKLEDVPIWTWKEYSNFIDAHMPVIPGRERDPVNDHYDTEKVNPDFPGMENVNQLQEQCWNNFSNLRFRRILIAKACENIILDDDIGKKGLALQDKAVLKKENIVATYYKGTPYVIFSAHADLPELSKYYFAYFTWWIYDKNKKQWVSHGTWPSYETEESLRWMPKKQ